MHFDQLRISRQRTIIMSRVHRMIPGAGCRLIVAINLGTNRSCLSRYRRLAAGNQQCYGSTATKNESHLA